MPKTASSDLFDLIQSLSKAEKAAFKIYVRRNDSKSLLYLKLFDLLERRKKNDETKTIRSLNIAPRRFPELKHYLYNLILKSLNDFHRNQKVSSQLAEYYSTINLLFEKGLYEQCKKKLNKAKALALKFEKHTFLIELFEFEIIFNSATQYSGVTERNISDINTRVNNSIDMIRANNDYSVATEYAFLRTYRDGGFRNKKDAQFIVKLYNQSIVNSKKKLRLPFNAALARYSFLFRYYVDLRDFNKAYRLMLQAIGFIESNPHQIPENPKSYAAAVSNTIICLLNLKKYKEVPAQLQKLSGATASNPRVGSFVASKIFSYEMDLCRKTGDFEKGMTHVGQLENFLSKNKLINAQTILLLYYYSVIICIGIQDYNRANYFLRKIIDGNFSELRMDVFCFAKILSLIVSYELNNNDYIEYAVKSVFRYLHKRKRLYKVESVILEFIKNEIPKIFNESDRMNAFKKLRERLLVFRKDPFEREAFEYFDFISWLESKIDNKTFAELIREKNQL
ncbi:MAG: hypothetical protein IT235_05545 [Bacteroidia bacterium]|nr:hypothetical protein [Bacteroidia bacterium]